MMGSKTILGLAAIVLVMLSGLAGSAGAYSVQPIITVIDFPHDCELRYAKRLPTGGISKLARSVGDAWSGCVKVRGLATGGYFFPDPDAYYRQGGEYSFEAVGFYTDNPELLGDGPGRARWVEVSGFIAECGGHYFDRSYKGKWEPPKDGYCAKGYGMVLIVKEAHVGEPFLLTRLTGDADRRRVGNLDLVPALDIAPAQIRELANAWLAAVRSGDRQAYVRLAGGDAHPAELRLLFDDPGLGWLRSLPADRPIQLMSEVVKDRWNPFREPDLYIGCVCRDADCTGRWPISTYDSYLNASRPYACVSFIRPYNNLNASWGLYASLDPRRLREPVRSR